MYTRCFLLIILTGMFFSSCRNSAPVSPSISESFPPKPVPESYVSYRATTPIIADGVADEKDWNMVPWTNLFRDIEGSKKPEPWFKTHAKLLWDDDNLYILAELEEPHVWAKLRQRDTVIFYDNDFEVFIDPDGDTHAYYELEVNALGTAWDLMLLKPYRDGGAAVNGWDISGLKVGIGIDGTLNNPKDEDKGWVVEIAIPFRSMKEWRAKGKWPVPGEQWRLGFSRVEWKTHVENGAYVKDINPSTGRPFPEENWIWSPQGRINMHMPEMWGYLQFSGINAGSGTESFIPDPDFDLKWALRLIYYAENEYYAKNKKYTSNLEEIGLTISDFPENAGVPVIMATRTTFESYFEGEYGKGWTIYNDGKIIKSGEPILKK